MSGSLFETTIDYLLRHMDLCGLATFVTRHSSRAWWIHDAISWLLRLWGRPTRTIHQNLTRGNDAGRSIGDEPAAGAFADHRASCRPPLRRDSMTVLEIRRSLRRPVNIYTALLANHCSFRVPGSRVLQPIGPRGRVVDVPARFLQSEL